MKHIIFCTVIFLLAAGFAGAQVNKPVKKVQKKTVMKKAGKTETASRQGSGNTIILRSATSYPAKSNFTAIRAYNINDPLLKAFNEKAKGTPIKISNSGIAGMPKRAYGFGNGRLTFYTTGATSSGTATGSGLVGTGSSLGSIGVSGSRVGLNGKSPYAGSSMWGNARGLLITRGDSAVRRF